MPVSKLLQQHTSLFNVTGKPVLDLACGSGRNGLHLLAQGIPVIFADKNSQALAGIAANQLNKLQVKPPQCWQVDFETSEQHRLKRVFKYLVYLYVLRKVVFNGNLSTSRNES